MVLGAIILVGEIASREQITVAGMGETVAMVNFLEESPSNMAMAIWIGTIATRLTIIVEGIIGAMRRISTIEWIDLPMLHAFEMGETAGHRVDPRPQSASRLPPLHLVTLKAETTKGAEGGNSRSMIVMAVLAVALSATIHDTVANHMGAGAMATKAVEREGAGVEKGAKVGI